MRYCEFPPDSGMASDLCDLPQTNRRPPWYGPKRTLLYYWSRLTKGDIKVEDLPWGTFSSGMVTYLAKKHRVDVQAQSPAVFYPVRWKDARALFGPAESDRGNDHAGNSGRAYVVLETCWAR